MVFKRLLGGLGGPSVDTVLDGDSVPPGGVLSGQVRLRGGGAAVDVDHIALELVARVEADQGAGREGGENGSARGAGESGGLVAFERFTIGGGFRLGEEELRSVPFEVSLPWEAPVTELHGRSLGVALGVRTELAAAGEVDRSELDPLAVRPLAVQEAVLDALGRIGFDFRSADLEHGRIGGTSQRLPFRQEVELAPAPQYAHQVDEVELTFLAGPTGVEVVLEADKRGGSCSEGDDALARFTVGHHHTGDWSTEVDGWVRQLVEHRAAYGTRMAYDGHDDVFFAEPRGEVPAGEDETRARAQERHGR
ncbi:sporulation protein [Streptomyces sp. MS06]|uniref:sporulation protein n=1 Tax=Streptomyces sp. MS06 TaxID=3385974 RepID=UPI0039A23DA6